MKKTAPDAIALRKEGETLDDILGGKISILQKKKGYRFSLDALLLAHFVRLKRGDHVIDLGTGSGVVAIITARRKECGRIVGVDIQEDLVDMARRNVEINALVDKVDILRGDARNIDSLFNPQSFHAIIFNPPYRKLKSGRINPDNQKSVARHEIKGTLHDFLKAAGYVLKKSGRVSIIYPATRMVELLTSMRIAGVEPKRLRMVHSHSALRGEFVLAEGVKGGREELEILPPLFIYDENGNYTEAMTGIFRELSDLATTSAG